MFTIQCVLNQLANKFPVFKLIKCTVLAAVHYIGQVLSVSRCQIEKILGYKSMLNFIKKYQMYTFKFNNSSTKKMLLVSDKMVGNMYIYNNIILMSTNRAKR